MTKHTKGPLVVSPEKPWYGTWNICTPDGECIASVWQGKSGWEVAKANALMFHAAPEMQAACEALIERCENPFLDPSVWEFCQEFKMAVAAIAKARGTQSKGEKS